MKTKVIFLIDKPADNFTGKDEIDSLGVFAYFPELEHSNVQRTCYSHIGQHSACHPDYARECKEATVKQYLDLYEELLSIGYDLKVLNKQKVRTIDRIIYPVSSRYGAPMGRTNRSPQAYSIVDLAVGKFLACPISKRSQRIFDARVPMSDGAYDKGGAYWGIGKELRVRYTKDLSYIEFYRVGDN